MWKNRNSGQESFLIRHVKSSNAGLGFTNIVFGKHSGSGKHMALVNSSLMRSEIQTEVGCLIPATIVNLTSWSIRLIHRMSANHRMHGSGGGKRFFEIKVDSRHPVMRVVTQPNHREAIAAIQTAYAFGHNGGCRNRLGDASAVRSRNYVPRCECRDVC